MTKPPHPSREPGQYTSTRYAWIDVEIGKFVILVGNESGEPGEDVVLFNPRPGKIPDIAYSLTTLTEEELVSLKVLFDAAFDWALPTVKKRDKEAKDAWNAGNDAHVRNYRAAPNLVFRKRPVTGDGESVQQRPDGVPEGSGGAVSTDGGVRGTSDELVESGEDKKGPFYSWKTPD